MSTLAELGSIVSHEGKQHCVVRMIDSSTFFETEDETYILEERYAELRQLDNNAVNFLMFSSIKHPLEIPAHEKQTRKGLNPSIWKRF